jgi:hypothetical protein
MYCAGNANKKLTVTLKKEGQVMHAIWVVVVIIAYCPFALIVPFTLGKHTYAQFLLITGFVIFALKTMMKETRAHMWVKKKNFLL